MNQTLIMQEGECTFNMPLKLRKSFEMPEDMETELTSETEGYATMPEHFKRLDLAKGKYFWGYANVEKVDMQNDLFPIETLQDLAPGLTKSPYNKIFINHNYDEIAVGTIVATAVDGQGLLILARLNEEHSRAYEVWQSILNGSLDGLSMGGSFLEVDSFYDEEMDMTITVAKKATATEVSLTSIPVNGASLLMGAFKKAQVRYNKKFGDPKMYAKGVPVDPEKKQETFKYNKSQKKCMVDKKDFNDVQKAMFDKAVSEGKSEDDALKLVNDAQVEEAEENVNQDLVGKKEVKQDKEVKKKIKKSVEEESNEEESETTEEPTEEPAAEESEEAETSEETTEEKSEEAEEESTEDESESTEEETEPAEESTEKETTEESTEDEPKDYKKAYNQMKEENVALKEEIATFKKSMTKTTKKETKPARKSVKGNEEVVPNTLDSSKQSKTPFLNWMMS